MLLNLSWKWSCVKLQNLPLSFQVNMLIPFSYMLFWVVLLGFSLYSEPVVCGLGMVIMLTGVPIYFVGVRWRDKPKWIYRLVGEWSLRVIKSVFLCSASRAMINVLVPFLPVPAERVTYVGQKLCYVVFPQADPSETEPLTTHKNSDWLLPAVTADWDLVPRHFFWFCCLFFFVFSLFLLSEWWQRCSFVQQTELWLWMPVLYSIRHHWIRYLIWYLTYQQLFFLVGGGGLLATHSLLCAMFPWVQT